MSSSGSFGANPLRQEIGLGKAARVEALDVFWPATNAMQRFPDVPADQFIEITEGEDQYRRLPWRRVKFPHPK